MAPTRASLQYALIPIGIYMPVVALSTLLLTPTGRHRCYAVGPQPQFDAKIDATSRETIILEMLSNVKKIVFIGTVKNHLRHSPYSPNYDISRNHDISYHTVSTIT